MSAWKPILHDAMADQCVETARAIGIAIDARRDEFRGKPDWGPALLTLNLRRAGLVRGDGGHLEEYVENRIGSLQEGRPALYGGFSGAGWLVAHLQRTVEPADVEAFQDIDAALVALMNRTPWRGHYDLISGLVGFAAYLFERPRPLDAAAGGLLAKIVEHLIALAVPAGDGCAWRTAPELLPEWQRREQPDGYFNIGVAHGIPGVLWVLARALREGLHVPAGVLEGGVRWLLAQQDADGGFPNWVPRDGTHRSTLAWCYGSLGVASVLLDIGRFASRPDWESKARAIALHDTQRSVPPPRDAGLCHGAAGIAHIFNTLYQRTGDNTFADAARVWIGKTFERRVEGRGFAGYQAWISTGRDRGSPMTWADDPTFLTGASGIGLAFLAAATDVAPDWQGLLLLGLDETR